MAGCCLSRLSIFRWKISTLAETNYSRSRHDYQAAARYMQTIRVVIKNKRVIRNLNEKI